MNTTINAFVSYLEGEFPSLRFDIELLHHYKTKLPKACKIYIRTTDHHTLGRLTANHTTVIDIHTDYDHSRSHFTDLMCGSIDLTDPTSIESIRHWIHRQHDDFINWRIARNQTPETALYEVAT